MDNYNFDGQALVFKSDSAIEDFLSDDQHPLEYATNSCAVPVGRLQNLTIADTHLSPLASVGFAHSMGHMLPAHRPTATGAMDCSVASNPGPFQSQWSEMSPSLTREPTCVFAPYPQNHRQVLPGTLCGWTQDLERFLVPHSITDIPQSLLPMHTHSNSDAEQYDACTRYYLGRTAESCSSSHEHTALSASGFFRAPADYDFPCNARADTQPSVSLTHNAIPSIQSTALPYSEPICTPDGQTRTFKCQWVTNGALCGELVMADRRSVIKHLRAHDIRPGEDKARQTCLWESCTTTLNKESLVRHILTVHLKEGVGCVQCGLSFAREDSLKRHLKKGQHRVSSDKSAARQPVRNHARSRRPEH